MLAIAPHELDRVANGVGYRMKIGVPDITPSGIVPQRGGAGWMEANRYVQPLELVPQGLARVIV